MTCPHCSTTFDIDSNRAYLIQDNWFYDAMIQFENFSTVKCPECGNAEAEFLHEEGHMSEDVESAVREILPLENEVGVKQSSMIENIFSHNFQCALYPEIYDNTHMITT